MRVNWVQFFRKTHLYVGVFTAPAILFFALSGTLQTFSLHETAREGSYTPPRWILLFAQIHKKQTAQVPVPKVALQRPAATQKKIDLAQPPAAQPTARSTGPTACRAGSPQSPSPQNFLPDRRSEPVHFDGLRPLSGLEIPPGSLGDCGPIDRRNPGSHRADAVLANQPAVDLNSGFVPAASPLRPFLPH
jgi:hypothetical protein